MTLQEFAALKVGDKIDNSAFGGGKGEVTSVDPRGVSVSWAGTAPRFYSVQSTIWFHWEKVDAPVHD